jgi:multidrug resistance efflux pump
MELFSGYSFKSKTFRARDARLKTARRETDRAARELDRDQRDISRRQTQLFNELRKQIHNGDAPKAKIVVQHLNRYRDLENRAYERKLWLQTEAQLCKSNNKINQAHVEFLKGMNYVDYGSVASYYASKKRVEARQDEHESIEALCNLVIMQ